MGGGLLGAVTTTGLPPLSPSPPPLLPCVPSPSPSSLPLPGLAQRSKAVAEVVLSLSPTALPFSSQRELDPFLADVIAAKATSAYSQGPLSLMESERAFYVMDLGEVLRLWDLWTSAMPRVHPFFAVKCNPDPVLLRLLAALGAGFDVASYTELSAVAAACGGTPPVDRIIFANPCKLPSHIQAAAERGVHLSTFDSMSELAKLSRADPGRVRAVLRLRVDDPSARCTLGVKYGAHREECRGLMEGARDLGVDVAGVAFHVGSGAGDAGVFGIGVAAARHVFDMGASLGFKNMTVLDIGGGFTPAGASSGGASFCASACAVARALEEHFPESQFPGLRVMGEPGRFFAETPFTLAAQVFGKRVRGEGEHTHMEYWINDGVYGSMNCLMYDHAVLNVRALPIASATSSVTPEIFPSTVFGPTCDGIDTVLQGQMLPELQCGDWLLFPRMGAYTRAAGSAFNGFSVADIKVAAYIYTPPTPSLVPAGGKGQDDGIAPVMMSGMMGALGHSSVNFGSAMSWKSVDISMGSDSEDCEVGF